MPPVPAPDNPKGIILANPSATAISALDPTLNSDPLDALHMALLDDMEAKANVDMFLNLQKFEDIEMSTDSTKRKRCKDGEEVTSYTAQP